MAKTNRLHRPHNNRNPMHNFFKHRLLSAIRTIHISNSSSLWQTVCLNTTRHRHKPSHIHHHRCHIRLAKTNTHTTTHYTKNSKNHKTTPKTTFRKLSHNIRIQIQTPKQVRPTKNPNNRKRSHERQRNLKPLQVSSQKHLLHHTNPNHSYTNRYNPNSIGTSNFSVAASFALCSLLVFSA